MVTLEERGLAFLVDGAADAAALGVVEAIVGYCKRTQGISSAVL